MVYAFDKCGKGSALTLSAAVHFPSELTLMETWTKAIKNDIPCKVSNLEKHIVDSRINWVNYKVTYYFWFWFGFILVKKS